MGYSGFMFDVLVYLYENYWRPDACPDHAQLTRKLSAMGFESDEIEEALTWLDGLATAAESYVGEQQTDSLRVYSAAEQEHLGERSPRWFGVQRDEPLVTQQFGFFAAILSAIWLVVTALTWVKQLVLLRPSQSVNRVPS